MLFGDGEQSLLRRIGLGIDEIHDHALMSPDDASVWLAHEVADGGRVPVISPSHGTGIVHALLHHRPLAAAAHDEGVQIKLEAVGNGVVVDASGEAAGAHQRVAIEAGFVSEGAEFVWGSARVLSASAADMDSEFVRAGIDSA